MLWLKGLGARAAPGEHLCTLQGYPERNNPQNPLPEDLCRVLEKDLMLLQGFGEGGDAQDAPALSLEI